MNRVQKFTLDINREIDRMIQLASAQPLDTVERKPGEQTWSMKEILCHVEEASRFWVDEVLAVVKKKREVWGRTVTDEKRLAGVVRAKELPTDQILQDLEEVKPFIRESLSTLQEEDLLIEAPSRNPKFGTQSMAFVLDHFMVEHIQNHVKQMKRNLP